MQITEQSRTEIVLATINSTYQHTAFGLRYLQSNLAELEPRSIVKEFTLEKAPELIASELLSLEPKIIGLGIYIWNAEQSLELVKILKARAPQVVIVIGGPEVSYESEKQEIVHRADYLIQGEADFQFRDLCRELLSADSQLEAEPASTLKQQKIIPAKLPEIKNLESPYRLYSDNDIKSRYIYVEVSRGCPYRCEYCLSSLDKSVRSFDLEIFLGEMDHLISRGARQFKFIDRTFNLSPSTST
ncbi:MAG: cobalamin-dependent protein, partial [Proteobacteria bacterium]|nr:cobalamin-dependent protein [Pseudomonadota bacterium]